MKKGGKAKVCGWVWVGPRVDVPEAEVNHFCQSQIDHEGDHRCICGASGGRSG